MQKPNHLIILLTIVAAAFIGFAITFVVLSRHLRYEPAPPPFITLQQGTGGQAYRLPVIRKDTVGLSQMPVVSTAPTVSNVHKLFHQNKPFIVWVMLILIMIIIASSACPVFFVQAVVLVKQYRLGWLWPLALLIALVTIGVLLWLPSRQPGIYSPNDAVDALHILLYNGGSVLRGIVIATVLLSLPTLFVMLLVALASGRVAAADADHASFLDAAQRIDNLNKMLNGALQVLATIVVFSVLTSSMLRESIRASVEIPGFNLFPDEFSYVYGLNFSVFLGILYVPVYFLLRSRAHALIGQLERSAVGKDIEGGKWYENVKSKLSLNNSAVDNMKVALTLAAPLISSFLPQLVKQ